MFDDDLKIGVIILGMRDPRARGSRSISSATPVGSDTWARMSEEVLEITRAQQYLDSTPQPMNLGALPGTGGQNAGRGKGRGRGRGKGRGKGKSGTKGSGKGKEQGRRPRTEPGEAVLLLRKEGARQG